MQDNVFQRKQHFLNYWEKLTGIEPKSTSKYQLLLHFLAQMVRNIEAVGSRFHFLEIALKLTQGDFPDRNRFSRNMLRYRIYMAALDYFTLMPQIPVLDRARHLTTIRYVFKFWKTLQRDLKHIRKEPFGLGPIGWSEV